ncbi:uncharacterized protein LOC117177266 isoform X2 [Belonocnema kinseyi]|nr:uncharacterized protein LOC117177266 isoform X2 [Belonocnema kinseyi]
MNASGIHGPSSSRPHNYPNVPPPAEDPDEPHKIATYVTTRGEYKIKLWLDDTRSLVERASLPKFNNVPNGSYYWTHNFITRSVTCDGLRFVIYIEDEKVIGARAPRRPQRVNPNALEPNESTWFITYNRKNFKVKKNMQTEEPVSITLMPKNLHRNPAISRQNLLTNMIAMGGIFFIIYQKRDLTIVGAELDSAWHNSN